MALLGAPVRLRWWSHCQRFANANIPTKYCIYIIYIFIYIYIYIHGCIHVLYICINTIFEYFEWCLVVPSRYGDLSNILEVKNRLKRLPQSDFRTWRCQDATFLWISDTSSTAQGGGGSFKNRKPIGEVGCCESGMAERSHWWTERCLISLSLFLSFSPCFSIFLWLSTYLPTDRSVYLFICLSLYLSISTYLSV